MQVSISLESGTPGFYVLLDYVDPFPKKIALLARMINTYPPFTIVSINNVRSDYFIINFTIITRIKTTVQNDLNPFVHQRSTKSVGLNFFFNSLLDTRGDF